MTPHLRAGREEAALDLGAAAVLPLERSGAGEGYWALGKTRLGQHR